MTMLPIDKQLQSNTYLPNTYMWKEKKIGVIFGFILFGLFCALCFKDVALKQDSAGYINNISIRAPLYPIILSAYTKLFGPNNFQILAYLQILAGFLTAFFTASKIINVINLESNFVKLPKILFYLIVFLLLFPYYGPSEFGNVILTEALCYPLFLLTFSYLLEGLQNKSTKALLLSIVLSGLLILTRGQFLFLYPAIGIILSYILIFERKAFHTLLLIFCFITTIVGANLFERTYQYIYHGQFKKVPFTGIQLIVAPLYLAKESDADLFNNETEKALFKDIWAVMEEKKINFNSLNEDSFFHFSTYTHFYHSYNRICWESFSPLLSKYGLTNPYQNDIVLTRMGLTLICHNLKAFFILYILNIVFNLGGIYYLLLLGAATVSALAIFFKTRHPLSMAYLLITLLSAGNYLLIAVVEPVLRRYSAYTDGLQASILLILITFAFQSAATKNSFTKDNKYKGNI